MDSITIPPLPLTSRRPRQQPHCGDGDSGTIPVASTSSSDPGPGSGTRVRFNLASGTGSGGGRVAGAGRPGHFDRRTGRRGGAGGGGGRRRPGNRSRSMFTHGSEVAASNFGHSPPGIFVFPHTPHGNPPELIPESTGGPYHYAHFQQPSSATVISYMDQHLAWNARGETVSENIAGCVINPRGFITLRLNPYLRIDISVGKGFRIQDDHHQIIMALSGNGRSCCLIHPSGCMYQYGSRVEVSVPDPLHQELKMAKMWHKGISFASNNSTLIYLVDSAGVRTTTDVFSDLSGDISYPVFRSDDSLVRPEQISKCMEILRHGHFWVSNDKTENWTFNGIKISCSCNGIVRIVRGNGKYIFRTSGNFTNGIIATPFVDATASIGNDNEHTIFVKRGERRLHYDGQTFAVRNGGHSAGFDFRNKLKVM